MIWVLINDDLKVGGIIKKWNLMTIISFYNSDEYCWELANQLKIMISFQLIHQNIIG